MKFYIVEMHDSSDLFHNSSDLFYIADREDYVDEKGLVYVPITYVPWRAKKYETRELAEKASKAKNILDRYIINIIEADENDERYRFSN